MGGFKKFLLRGNLIDLAVAVVVGLAFNSLIQALVKDIVTPLIAALGGKPNFSSLTFTIHNSVFSYGDFLNALISFIVIALVVYFFLVAPTSRLTALAQRKKGATEHQCPECLSTIPIGAHRCMYCTAVVNPDVPQT
jgi:large conductance mechanosensitive channel